MQLIQPSYLNFAGDDITLVSVKWSNDACFLYFKVAVPMETRPLPRVGMLFQGDKGRLGEESWRELRSALSCTRYNGSSYKPDQRSCLAFPDFRWEHTLAVIMLASNSEQVNYVFAIMFRMWKQNAMFIHSHVTKLTDSQFFYGTKSLEVSMDVIKLATHFAFFVTAHCSIPFNVTRYDFVLILSQKFLLSTDKFWVE